MRKGSASGEYLQAKVVERAELRLRELAEQSVFRDLFSASIKRAILASNAVRAPAMQAKRGRYDAVSRNAMRKRVLRG